MNRTISLVTGQTGPSANDKNSTPGNDTVDDSRHNMSLQTSASSTSANMTGITDNRLYQPNDKSPLQIFVRAKKKINDIYGEIEEYVLETTTFITGKKDHCIINTLN